MPRRRSPMTASLFNPGRSSGLGLRLAAYVARPVRSKVPGLREFRDVRGSGSEWQRVRETERTRQLSNLPTPLRELLAVS